MATKTEKPLTPAQTAKPLGTAAKQASLHANKKAEAAAPEPAAVVAKDDPAKAIERLETRVKAVNVNNIARVTNSYLTSADDKLQPLMSLKTAKSIDKFPATPKDISKLGLAQLDTILHALDAERTGNEEIRRERLRVQIGLKPNPA